LILDLALASPKQMPKIYNTKKESKLFSLCLVHREKIMCLWQMHHNNILWMNGLKSIEKTVENFKSPLGNFKVNILISCVFVLQSS